MNKDLIIKRLSIIKYLYKQGLEISRQPESLAFHSILLFHDSIEMFLKLTTTFKNIKGEFSFIKHWENIPELTLKESMETFNKVRVNLKHHGIMPSKIDLETSRVIVTDFFIQATPKLFNINFEDVNLFDLVTYTSVKQYLIKSQSELDADNFIESVGPATIAFYELLSKYQDTKSGFRADNKFSFGNRVDLFGVRFSKEIKAVEPILKNVVEKINTNLQRLNEGLQILSFGIDYKRYSYFKNLTPQVWKNSSGEYHLTMGGERIWDKGNCQFLIDFVLDSAIKLQEFDYHIDSVRPPAELLIPKLL